MKLKKFLITLICLFIPSKKLRKKIRNKFYGRDIIKTLQHDFYGKIYLPIYNLDYKFCEPIQDVYNEKGKLLEKCFIRDLVWASNPSNPLSDYVYWDRYNIALKKHFYTHDCMLETMGNPDKKYGMLVESEAIVPNSYKIFDKHKGLEKDFDLIFTYSQRLLDKLDNAKFVPFCAEIWYPETTIDNLQNKTKNISLVSSNKLQCKLHKVRFDLANKLKKGNLVDTFGNFDGGPLIDISETLTNYRYTIAIENIVSPLFFTERITNCFASMTIPIYLGATKIDEFFNPDGIIKITEKDLDNIENILKKCTKEEYESRLSAIIDNYNRVQKYYNVFDKQLYEEYLLND